MNGEAIKSCTVFALQANGAQITTIEGLAKNGKLHPVQQAFTQCHALQCGFCTPGMIMSVAGLLKNNPKPTDEQIYHGLEGNLCRCTGYVNIVKAVKKSAELLATQKQSR
jgi:carbon-monoxide dehydrogenase small subunit